MIPLDENAPIPEADEAVEIFARAVCGLWISKNLGRDATLAQLDINWPKWSKDAEHMVAALRAAGFVVVRADLLSRAQNKISEAEHCLAESDRTSDKLVAALTATEAERDKLQANGPVWRGVNDFAWAALARYHRVEHSKTLALLMEPRHSPLRSAEETAVDPIDALRREYHHLASLFHRYVTGEHEMGQIEDDIRAKLKEDSALRDQEKDLLGKIETALAAKADAPLPVVTPPADTTANQDILDSVTSQLDGAKATVSRLQTILDGMDPAAPASGVATTVTVKDPTKAGSASIPVTSTADTPPVIGSTVNGPGIVAGTIVAPTSTASTIVLSDTTAADHEGGETITITTPPTSTGDPLSTRDETTKNLGGGATEKGDTSSALNCGRTGFSSGFSSGFLSGGWPSA